MINEEVVKRKKILRKIALVNRRSLSAHERKIFSKKIHDIVIKNLVLQKAKTVFIFVSLFDEVDTLFLIDFLLKEGKKVYIPFIKGKLDMRLVEIYSREELVQGAYGILSLPLDLISAREFLDYDNLDFVFVPGVAFSTDGKRLGMGGGFYDIFLQKAKNAYTLAVAFSCQMFADIPCVADDYPVKEIVTELDDFICQS